MPADDPATDQALLELAEVLATQGDEEGARWHWREYLRQDPNSPWAQRVRDRLK